MKIQLLPSSFDSKGRARPDQRLTCYLIDDCVAVDAGSLALALTDAQRESVRDIIITHTHLDHIATLPIFIDDLFATLTEPVRVHSTPEVIEVLERDVFNWTLYPRFSELRNKHGHVLEYLPLSAGREFQVAHLKACAVSVNHSVPTIGLLLTDGRVNVAFSSDTAATEAFWHLLNDAQRLDALLIEASFPNALAHLAETSGHLTPAALATEICKLKHNSLDILAVHLKPAYREALISELAALELSNLNVIEPGREYVW